MKLKNAWKMTAALVAVLFLVASCGGPLFVTKQENAGLTHWKAGPNVKCLEAAKTDKTLCYELEVFDGKEKQNVKFEITRSTDGVFKVTYNATAVKAFEGQAIRAAVEIEVAKALKDILPGMVDSLVKAILKSIKPI